MITASYKIGVNKGRPRIWIDGKKLADAGFKGGTAYFCAVKSGQIRCTLAPVPSQDLSIDSEWKRIRERRVTGRPDGKPIIDMLGQDVEIAFPGAERVKVTFKPGILTIEREV